MSVLEEDHSPSRNSSDPSDGYPLERQISVGTTISTMIVFTIIGNLMVMRTFYRNRRISRKIANWCIVNMSVEDFTVGCSSLVLSQLYGH